MTYRPSLHYERTEAEMNDQILSWNRPDIAFFASGACHILAWTFVQTYPDAGFAIVHIRPRAPFSRGHHVIATDGVWAFDYSGWTKERELFNISKAAYADVLPGWDFDRVVIDVDLETFCIENTHRLPSQFAFDPWQRAKDFMMTLDPAARLRRERGRLRVTLGRQGGSGTAKVTYEQQSAQRPAPESRDR
jgi:hypothetical protein